MFKKVTFRLIAICLWFLSILLTIGIIGMSSTEFVDAGDFVFSVIADILVIFIGYLFWRRSSIDTMPSKLKNYNKKSNAKVKTNNPSLINVSVKNERELPKHVYQDMPKFYTDMQLQNDLRILEESVDLMKSTKNLETFIGRYDLACRTALNIEQAKTTGIPIRQKFISFREVRDLADTLTPIVLNDSYLRMKMDAFQLKTKKGQLRRFEKYLELLKEYEFDLDFTDNYESIVSKVEEDINSLEEG